MLSLAGQHPMPNASHQQLITTIYAATLAPHNFAQMVDLMEAQTTQIIAEAAGQPDADTPLPEGTGAASGLADIADLTPHIETAQRIQSRMGFHADDPDMIDVLLVVVPNPAVVFDRDERILRRNARAQCLECGMSPNLAGLFPSADQLAEIRKAIRALDSGLPFAAVPLNLDCDKDINDCAIIKRIQVNGGTGRNSRLYMMNLAHFSFDDTMSESFKDVYRLTDAETAVAVRLASGTSVEEIARLREVSQQTVRSQIKAIKSKTHVRDLPDLARLLCGFSLSIAMPTSRKDQARGNRSAGPSLHAVHLPDGRSMDYLIQGDPKGRPILLFHGLPHGLQLPEAARGYARRHRLKLIAPLRPGIGGSDPLPDLSGTAYLDQVAGDTQALCETLAIDQAKLLGIGGGSTFAIRFAALYPDKVSDILMVQHAPMWRPERLDRLPTHLRLLAQLAGHMPQLAIVLAGAILTSISKHDHRTFAKNTCQGSLPDLQALDEAELTALMDNDIKVTLKSDPETLAREWGLLTTDLCEEAERLPHRLHLMHGAEDRVLTPEFSQQFARAVPQTKLNIIDSAGHYLLYSHWRHVMDALIDMQKLS